jgi:predicted transcriptional regulator
MSSAKQEVMELLEQLPDDCSLEDIQYHLYVLQKVLRGLANIEKGHIYTQEDVEKQLDECLNKDE